MNEFHFYASNVFEWVTTNETRDLPALIKMMDKADVPYSLFYVPVPHTANYEIRVYQPQVEGTIWLGAYKKGKKYQ